MKLPTQMADAAVKKLGAELKTAASIFAYACCDADKHAADGDKPSVSYCYDVDKTWVENIAAGLPQRCRNLPPVDRCWAPVDKWVTFLGQKIASPLGVAAGPLLSAEWIGLAASRGFDCLTYKTIRSHYHAGHGLPNILHLQVDGQLPAAGPSCSQPLFAVPSPTTASPSANEPDCSGLDQHPCADRGSASLAITNSFGMPSLGPEEVVADLHKAATLLRPGQMMVVSVTGIPGRPGVTFVEDLAAAARAALRGGATALEVNLSCPNVGSSHVALYRDGPAVEATVRELRQAVGSVPVVLKVGAFPDPDSLRRVLAAATAAGANAVAGINGLSRRVELPGGGGPALGPDRPSSGVCGDPIREAGLDFVRQARQAIASDSLDLSLIGVGGVTQATHVMDYLEAGADVVQAATGFMWRPNLGLEFQDLWRRAGWALASPADGRGGRA